MKLCLLGATNEELADFFGTTTTTITNWQHAHPEFLAALKEGKDAADSRVAERLYRRALGYSHEAVKIVADAKSGTDHVVPYTEHYPPDTTACIFWLKNRQPRYWRDKHEVGHSVEKGGVLIVPAPITTEDWAAAAEEQQSGIAEKRGGG